MNEDPYKFSDKKPFIRNLTSNVGFFGMNALLSVWFISYLVHHLGVAVYGLIPLAMTVTSYMNLLTFGLNASVARYMTIALEQSNGQEVKKIFNTAFWGSVFISGVLLIPGGFLAIHAQRFFNVPSGYETQVKWLFLSTVGAFIVTTLGSAFNIIAYCRNRFDLQNLINISGVLSKIFLVVVFFTIFSPKLWQVNLGIFSAAVVTFIASLKIGSFLLPNQEIRFKAFDYSMFKKISATGIWVLIAQFGTILLLSIDLLVANKLFGPQLSGQYASVMQWSLLLRNFAIVVAGIFGPTILAYYARNEMDQLINYAKKAVKCVGFLVALPIGIICGLSNPLLNLWLGPEFVPLAPLLSLMTFHLCLNLGYLPLHSISMATNRLKVPAIVQIVFGFLNLILAVFFARTLNMQLYGIALAGAIVLSLKNIVFNPIYSAHIIHRPYTIFMNELGPLILLTGFVTAFSWGLSLWIPIQTWGCLIFVSLGVSLLYGLTVWKFLLNQNEKLLLENLLLPKLWGGLPRNKERTSKRCAFFSLFASSRNYLD